MIEFSWKRILHKKGVSPIIGMVLISAVLFSVLALVLVWSASQQEFQIQRERERIQQLKLVEGESIEFLTIPASLGGDPVIFYNNGSVPPMIKNIYINDTKVNSFSLSWDADNPRKGKISIGDAVTVTSSLKVETQLGNLYSYSTPSAVIDLLSWSDLEDKVRLLLDGSKSNVVGGSIVDWEWTYPGQTKQLKGARVQIEFEKGETSSYPVEITLTVTDNTDVADMNRQDTQKIILKIPAIGESGEGGGGYPGFGGEGAPGGIYISLGGTGGGTSIAEGRVIAFNIKNFSGKMIPLTSLRFYGIKNPSNYTCNRIYIAPVGEPLTDDDLYYPGPDNIDDGGIAEFTEPYYLGDRDEVHVELEASSGAKPKEGEVYMIILYDAATPQSYYTVTVPIRESDSTDVVVFDPADVFHVTGGGNVLQGKALNLNSSTYPNPTLMSIGVAFSSPDDETDPCDDRLVEFNVAGTAYWTGSVATDSTIYLGDDTDGDGVPDTGVTWDNSRTIQFNFNFDDVAKRFYYFVYRFKDGSSVAHKIPRFAVALASGEQERKTVDSSTGGTVTWDVDITQVDQLNTPVEVLIAGLPCYCTVTITPAEKVEMPNTVTVTIEVLPGAPTGLYPIVVTCYNKLNAYSCVLFLYIS
jgi:hypothetical protein